MLKGCEFQLAHGTGPQSVFSRPNSEQKGRLQGNGSSSHAGLGQEQPGPVSAVDDSADPACASAVCARDTGTIAATTRKSTSLQAPGKGKPQAYKKRSKNTEKSSADYAHAGQGCQCDMAA
ncbi:MAG: hypothetical protein ACLP9L_07290 [Thermoguttaceae bacterium]